MSEPIPLYDYDRTLMRGGCGVIAGVDEAGRGPLAGPVVAGAVILDLEHPLEGINDSKKLTEARRERAYELIVKHALAWGVGVATPAEIDSINILNASLLAMRRALDSLSVAYGLVLVDGNQRIPALPGAQTTVVKGDGTSASIAAASIIAKVTRDRHMFSLHEQYPHYGFDRHKGYPTLEHRQAVTTHGITPIHRRSFCESLITQTDLFA